MSNCVHIIVLLSLPGAAISGRVRHIDCGSNRKKRG